MLDIVYYLCYIVSSMARTSIVPKVGNNGLTLLEQTRIESGLTAAALAREAGISRAVLWKLESRQKDFSPRADTIAKILLVLNRRQRELDRDPADFNTLFETIGHR